MQIKTYEGITMKDAVKAVKSDLGADAVILSTSENVDQGSRVKTYQIKATAASAQASSPHIKGTHLGTNSKHTENVAGIENQLKTVYRTMARTESLEPLDRGLKEIKVLMLELLKNADSKPVKNMPDFYADLYQTLELAKIDTVMLSKLFSHLNALSETIKKDKDPVGTLRNLAIKWMMKRIKIEPSWTIIDGSNSIQAFVGASSSGKTSTIAKVAALYKKQQHTNVLIISADTNKIAANEDLKAYSRILDIPMIEVSNISEIDSILLKNRDTQLTLLDLPETVDMDESSLSYLGSNSAIAKHLVLSMTDKEDFQETQIRRFSKLGLNSLVFTKSDATPSYGELFNLTSRWSIPLGFLGTGNNVPIDIEKASRERVIQKIFGIN